MKEEEYMRVGTTLYKVVNQPCANGGYEKKRVVWNNSTLRQDYGKNYLATVPKYDGFCTVPNHLNYQKEIEGFLNLYEPIEHKPQQGEFSHIQSLMRHIFGEQYELGMDYMQLLYLQPTQKLPIVLLVSEERNTGKSTFLNFLKAVFENNVTFNTNEDFRSQFNSDWAGKFMFDMMSSNNSVISISSRLRLLRIIFCKAAVCVSLGLNHIRLSCVVDSSLWVRK